MTHKPDLLAGMSNSGELITTSAMRNNNRRKLFLILISSFLLLAAVTSIVSLANSKPAPESSSASHAILRSSCSSTLYPDLCYSSIATVPGLFHTIKNQKDVIRTALNLTKTAVEYSFFKVEKLTTRGNLTARENTALHDCLEMLDDTLDELRMTDDDLRSYPAGKPLARHADDLKTLVSAAMTNQESCLDGFSHDDVDRVLRGLILNGYTHVSHMCSNSLAMIKNITDGDIHAEALLRNRRLLSHDGEYKIGFPTWMSVGDRRLLQASRVTPNVVVAADGSGNYKTIAAAVAAAPVNSKRYVIRIKAGTYKENVEVHRMKTNIMFVGDGRKTTIITGSKNVKDGSTTFKSATLAVVGEGFLARDLTIQNTAGPLKHQAVALRVGSDRSAFYGCDIKAYEDTLYVHSLRQFFRGCLIQGTVDFIFGNAAVVLQDCDIQVRRPNSGQMNMVTAQGRGDPNQNTGISIQSCRITAASDLQPVKNSFHSFLGRPWKEYSRTVVMGSTISDVINPAGWHEWNGNFALDTLYYGEYRNTGAGAGTSKRVKWKGYRVITSVSVAHHFTVGSFIGGSNWLGSTGFPFSLRLSSL